MATLPNFVAGVRHRFTLPTTARAAVSSDHRAEDLADHGIEKSVSAALDWLAAAQDNSRSIDGGFARHYSLVDGWSASYPETSGYIIPTLIDAARRFSAPELERRARRGLDWLVSIQFDAGGFQGGVIGQTPVVPVTFNTGQILMGLAAGASELDTRYVQPMRRAADWLVETQDPDGAWRKFPTPFAAVGEKAYETHVSWGLLEAARVDESRGYAEAALRNIRWAISKQNSNGWIRDCCLNEPDAPLTHTIGYVLRGIVEGYRFSRETDLLSAAKRTANALVGCIDSRGFLPGRLDSEWQPRVEWACLTGSVQIAHSLLMLYSYTGKTEYRDAAFRANHYVRARVKTVGPAHVRGGVKGSFPVDGAYGQLQYLNWACKFFIDANLTECDMQAGRAYGEAVVGDQLHRPLMQSA